MSEMYLYQLPKLRDIYGNDKMGMTAENLLEIEGIDLGNLNSAKKFVKNLEIFTLAESLGGVESLVCHPATMTHASVPKNIRDEIGVTDGLIRLSIGIEDIEDLISDIKNAMEKIS